MKRDRAYRFAMEFPTQDALDKYLKDHPDADKANHSVKKQEDKSKAPADEKKGKPKSFDEESFEKRENIQVPGIEKVTPLVRERIEQYNLEVVGDDKKRAVEIAKKITEGIDKSADVCQVSPPVCEGNLGIPRDKMPQILGDASIPDMLKSDDPKEKAKAEAAVDAGADPDDKRTIMDQMLDNFKKKGVAVTKEKVPVGKLKATQKEIQAAKTIGMADAHLRGKFPNIDSSVVISSDNHILDGHHRWAALLTINPDMKMNVIRVDVPMRELLDQAFDMPGVFKADLQGNVVKKEKPKEDKKAASRNVVGLMKGWQQDMIARLAADRSFKKLDRQTSDRLRAAIMNASSKTEAEKQYETVLERSGRTASIAARVASRYAQVRTATVTDEQLTAIYHLSGEQLALAVVDKLDAILVHELTQEDIRQERRGRSNPYRLAIMFGAAGKVKKAAQMTARKGSAVKAVQAFFRALPVFFEPGFRPVVRAQKTVELLLNTGRFK